MDLKELEAIAQRELAKHNLLGWTFGFSDTKRRLGVCKYKHKRIEIARYYAQHSNRESVIDTLLHEIAHAIAGPAARHGPAWKVVAIRLGAKPRACEKSDNVVMEPGVWQAFCPACQTTFHRYRRPMSLTGYRCRCPGRSPLTFEFRGDAKQKARMLAEPDRLIRWSATCIGCQTVHYRMKRPKAGIWRCKCPYRCELTWQSKR